MPAPAAPPLRCSTLLAVALLAATACAPRAAAPASTGGAPSAAPAAPSVDSAPAPALPALADTLVRLGIEDQAGRDDLAQALTRGDTLFLKRSMAGDSARSRRLRAIVRAHGWPGRALVGDSAAGAAWLILQHSPELELQQELLPLVEAAAARGEVPRADLAMLTDRVRSGSGRPQLYATQFSVVGGRLVPDSVEDLPGLEARRAAVGLPPMAEYVRMLAEAYRLPVVWPPAP